MKSLGGAMAFLGAGSFALNYFDREFSLLMWIDNWGPTAGTAIRVGMVVVGGAMWFIANNQETAAAASAE